MTSPYFVNCCPEAPQTINVEQVTLVLDSLESNFYVETFAFGDLEVVGGVYFVPLEHAPLSAGSVHVSFNTGKQVPTTDYIVFGGRLKLNFVPEAADIFVVHYFASSAIPSSSDIILSEPSGTSSVKSVIVTLPAAYQQFTALLVDTVTSPLVETTLQPAVSPLPFVLDAQIADATGKYTLTFSNLGGADALRTWYLVISSDGQTAISDPINLTNT